MNREKVSVTSSPRKRVSIFGAGIGGLTCAHELSKLGNYDINIYEFKNEIGGLARSSRNNEYGCATEYCWRVFFGFYGNMFRVMKEIPLNNNEPYERGIENTETSYSTLTVYKHINLMDPQPLSVQIKAYTGILKGLMSCDERLDELDAEGVTWNDMISNRIGTGDPSLFKTVGPWLGADRNKCSYRSVIKVGIEQQILPSYYPFTSYKDYVTSRPTSDAIFNPWRKLLESRGVKFHMNSGLDHIIIDDDKIKGCVVTDSINDIQTMVQSDIYILSVPIEVLSRVMKNSKGIDPDKFGLSNINTLAETCLHTQLSFQLYFNRSVSLGNKNAFLLVESPWDLIILSYDQASYEGICEREAEVKGAWSVAVTTAYVKGLNGKTFSECNYEEIIDELERQLFTNSKLQELIRENNGFDLDKNIITGWSKMWPTFKNGPDGKLFTTEPKFTNNAGSYKVRPSFKTYIPNLFISTAYVKETIDIFSMEAACLAGTLTSKAIDNRTPEPYIFHRPLLFAPFRAIDKICWTMGIDGVSLIAIMLALIIIYRQINLTKK